MRPMLLAPVLFMVAVEGLFAQRIQARFVTSAYAWQRQDTVGTSSNHLYGYQSVQLSVAQNDLSLHTYLQGFNDFAGPLKNDPKLRLYNLYMKWGNIGSMADVSLGRQFVWGGAGSGTIDGINASVKLMDSRIRLKGYYGSLTPPGMKGSLIENASENNMFGGQAVLAPFEIGQLSVSYVRKSILPSAYKATRRDSLFNPYQIEIRPSASIEELVSGDLSADYEGVVPVSAYLRYDYDVNLEQMSRFQFFTRVKPIDRLGLTVEYLQREPRISFNSIFSVFAYNSLKEYDFSAEYEVVPALQVYGKYGAVAFEGETSNQYTVGVNWRYVSASASRITGYNGKINAASLNAGYPLMDNMLTPTVMLTYGRYKLNQYQTKRDVALAAGVGVVYRPMQFLSVDTQVQWIQNTIYKNDVRLFLRGSYFLNEQLNLF